MKNDILGIIDITTYTSLKDLYIDLSSLKKERFLDSERIILIYNLETQKKLLTELITVIDIPNFFVIFQKKESTDPGYIDFSFSDTHCVYAWSNLEIRNNGTITPCCKFSGSILNEQGEELSIQNSTLKDAYLSKFMQDLRADLFNGKRPSQCRDCWINESGNKNSSLRDRGKHKFKEIYYTLDYKKEDFNNLRSLDLKLGNTCNLACRICSPLPSSKIASLELRAGRLSKVDFNKIKQATKWAETDLFWEQFLPIAKNLAEIDILGGEPLLVKSHYNFLKKLIDLGFSKNIKLDYASNGTIYSDDYLNLWKHFKEAKISFSIDDIGDRFEYQRNGATWSTVIDNIKKYLSIDLPNFVFELYPTINIQNVYYLPELIEWAKSMNFKVISYSFLHNPEYLSIENLSDRAKILVINKLQKYRNHHDMIDASIKIIENSNSAQTDFLFQMQVRDAERKQNFADHHSDIAKAMGYI